MRYYFSKDKLSKGWSWPLKRSELEAALDLVPEVTVRWVIYSHEYSKKDGNKLLVISCSYNGFSMPLSSDEFQISVSSVPSESRNGIHEQMEQRVLPEIVAWMRLIDGLPETRREENRAVHYYWENKTLQVEETKW
jgi:hypothetical protein